MMNLQRYKWLYLFFLIVLITPYIYISRYANPVADDFIYSERGRRNGVISEAIGEYAGWSGRYTSNILIFLNPLSFNSFTGYKLAGVLIIILLLISSYYFVNILFQRQIENYTTLIIAFLITALFLNQMPVLSEGIYWYTGMVNYQLGNVATSVYIGLLIQYCRENFLFKSKLIHTLFISGLLIICMGFNEVLMIVLDLFALICLFISRKHNLPEKQFFLYSFILTITCSLLLILAPGIEIRSGLGINNHRFLPALFFSFAQVVRFFFEWISSFPLLLLSVLYYFLHKELMQKNILWKRSFYLTPLYSSMLLFTIIFIAVFVPYWATGILGQHRTVNVAYYLFLICWFINLSVYFNFYEKQLEIIRPMNQQLKKWILFGVFVSLMVTKNGYDLLTDLFYGKARSFELQMQQRIAQVQTAMDTVYFQPITDPPKTLFLYDIKPEPGHWLNQAYNIYFGCPFPIQMKK